MFWTTLKLALLTLLVAWLATARGQVELAWGAWQITARPGALLLLLLLFLLLLFWGGRFFRELWSLPRNVSLWRRTRRRDAGYRALLQALSEDRAHGEGGEGANARLEKALEARRLLNKDSLSTLIAAQVAEDAADFKQAETLYQNLQRCDDTRFIATLSLARLARYNGDYEQAQSHTREAESLRAASLPLWVEKIEIARESGTPEDALSILDKIRRRGATLPSNLQRMEADLRIEAMRKAMEAGNEKEAVRQARLAYLSSPRNAIVAYAQRLADGGMKAKAEGRRLVRARWTEFEGRALAEVFFRLHGATKPIERARLVETLCAKHPSFKSRLLLCEMLLDAKVWARSAQLLENLATEMEESTRPIAQADWLSYNVLRARLAKEAHNDLEGQKYWLGRCAEIAKTQENLQENP